MTARPKQFWMTSTLQGRRWLAESRLEAVENNNSMKLEELLSYEASYRSQGLTSLLEKSLLKRSDEVVACVRLLLEKGADPCGCTGSGTPFLVLVSDAECLQLTRLMISSGADVNQGRAGDGATALHRAAWNGSVDMVKDLLQAGALVNAQDNQDRTPLLTAAQADEPEVLKLISLQTGSNINVCDVDSNSALHWAVAHENVDMVLNLIQMCDIDIDIQNVDGNSPLMLAAGVGNQEILDILVNNEADLTLRNTEGETALLLAAKQQHLACARSLISAGSDVNVLDDTGSTALFYLLNDEHAVALLLQNGADPDVKNSEHMTPLFQSVSNVYSNVVLMLLEANCDPSILAGITDEKYPLQVAIYGGLVMLARMLYIATEARGCDVKWLIIYLKDSNLIQQSHRDSNVKNVMDWLRGQLEVKQLCLQNICRMFIRRHLSSQNFTRKIYQLPLPDAMKKFLLLYELRQM